ncbi:hypothetical protein GCM10023405_49110 [Streptomonospora salina]
MSIACCGVREDPSLRTSSAALIVSRAPRALASDAEAGESVRGRLSGDPPVPHRDRRHPGGEGGRLIAGPVSEPSTGATSRPVSEPSSGRRAVLNRAVLPRLLHTPLNSGAGAREDAPGPTP